MAATSLWEILVPRYSNACREYTLEHHRQWDERVRTRAGGITILKPARGQWSNPDGLLFTDEMIPVRVHCTQSAIEQIMDQTLVHDDQEAIFAYEVSQNVLVRHRKR